jgi:hypothetical protein
VYNRRFIAAAAKAKKLTAKNYRDNV